MSAPTEPASTSGRAAIAAAADAFFAAIEAGDTEQLGRLYHPDAKIWHNYDQVEQSVEENMKVLRFIVRTLADRRYEEIRRIVLDDGFVQQHVLRGSTSRGKLDMPAMVRVWIVEGQVTRIEEYLDPAGAAILSA